LRYRCEGVKLNYGKGADGVTGNMGASNWKKTGGQARRVYVSLKKGHTMEHQGESKKKRNLKDTSLV